MVNVVMKTMCCFHKKGVNRSFSKSPESKIFNILTEGTAIGTTEHVDTYFHLELMWSSFTVLVTMKMDHISLCIIKTWLWAAVKLMIYDLLNFPCLEVDKKTNKLAVRWDCREK